MNRGKKYVEAAKAVDRATLYDTDEAVALVKKVAVAKFDETIEAHIRTGCDGRHADQQIRGAVVLPHGTGKTVRVLVFAKNAKAEEAKAAGAEFVGAEELVPKIQNEGWLDFDDGRCWTSRSCSRTQRLNAEPESRYRNHGRNQSRSGHQSR